MTLILISGPAEEPVTLDEARAQLRLDGTDEDALLTALVTSACAVLEAETRRAFVTQSWRLVLDLWPRRGIAIPLAPVSGIARLALIDADGAFETLDPSLYETALEGDAPRIVATGAWPAPRRRVGGIAVDFVSGYGAAGAVPAPLKQALLLLAAHWFETRTPVAFGETPSEIPLTVAALVAPYRRMHL